MNKENNKQEDQLESIKDQTCQQLRLGKQTFGSILIRDALDKAYQLGKKEEIKDE